jgi:hypothetical protein
MTQPGESARSRLWAAVRTPYPSHDYLRLVDLFFVALVMVGMLVFQHMVSNIDWTIPGTGDTPEEALAACLTDLRGADSRAAAAERESAVWAISSALRISHNEARRRLATVEGWPDDAEDSQ